MYLRLWKFKVKRGAAGEFERAYGAQGDWARLFERADGFVSTQLGMRQTRASISRSTFGFRARRTKNFASNGATNTPRATGVCRI